MQLFLFTISIALLCFQRIFSQSYGLDNNSLSHFSEYKIPETKLSILNSGASLSLTSNEKDYEQESSYNSLYTIGTLLQRSPLSIII
ncbi:MAG: hypothetical protein PVH88_10570 [Ignavibacteria bacterium]|jgi:hypothetical protein